MQIWLCINEADIARADFSADFSNMELGGFWDFQAPVRDRSVPVFRQENGGGSKTRHHLTSINIAVVCDVANFICRSTSMEPVPYWFRLSDLFN